MALLSENHNITTSNFIKYVENLDSSGLSQMLSSRILPSFLAAMHRHSISEFSQEALTYWTVDMLEHAMKPTTVQRYLGSLHTLYKETYKETDNSIKFTLPEIGTYNDETSDELKQTKANLQYLVNLAKINKKPNSKDHTYLNAFLYLLINPETSIYDIVDLRFSDNRPVSIHTNDIILAMRNAPQAQYVFPLEQGKRRRPAIVHDLLRGLRTASHFSGLKFGDSFSRDSITALWITAAIHENVAFEDIRAIVRLLPQQYSFLSLIQPSLLTDEKKTDILNIVASSFINNTTGWYVMRLRSGVTPDILNDELKFRKYPYLRQVEFYYPQRTVSKLVKKKAVAVDVPVIPGILFFRMRYDKISKMMSMIGDLAWCYKTSNSPGSPYSAIPQSEMMIFQRSVGSLTADVEMDIIASQPPLNIGDEVIIENGSPLDGQQAVIRKVKSIDGSLTYTLRLSDSEFIHWKEITVSAAELTKIELARNFD